MLTLIHLITILIDNTSVNRCAASRRGVQARGHSPNSGCSSCSHCRGIIGGFVWRTRSTADDVAGHSTPDQSGVRNDLRED